MEKMRLTDPRGGLNFGIGSVTDHYFGTKSVITHLSIAEVSTSLISPFLELPTSLLNSSMQIAMWIITTIVDFTCVYKEAYSSSFGELLVAEINAFPSENMVTIITVSRLPLRVKA